MIIFSGASSQSRFRVAGVGGRQPETFEVALFSPFSPMMGEKVADRPDEWAFNQFCVRKKAPSP